MLLKVTRPVRCEPPWTTVLAQLQRAFEVPEFHAEPRQRCKSVDDEPTAVAGVVIALVGIRLCLNRTVDTDLVGDPLFFPQDMSFTGLCAGLSVTEGTSGECLLHLAISSSALQASGQPLGKTTS